MHLLEDISRALEAQLPLYPVSIVRQFPFPDVKFTFESFAPSAEQISKSIADSGVQKSIKAP